MKKSIWLLLVFLLLWTSSFAYYMMVRAYYYPNEFDEEEIFGARIYIDNIYTGHDTPYTFSPYVGGTYTVRQTGRTWVPESAFVTVIPASGTLYFGTYDTPLPVELSSFTASISATSYVMLNWTTQSETNVAGFRLYRGTTDELSQALLLNTFIEATNTSSAQNYVYHDTELYDDGTYYYWLENQDLDGTNDIHGPVSIVLQLNNDPGTPPIPIDKGISSIYPNPFNPNTTIEFALDSRRDVEISIYSIKGQFVRNLLRTVKEPGYSTVPWDGKDSNGKDCTSGIYKVVMRSGTEIFTSKAVLIK